MTTKGLKGQKKDAGLIDLIDEWLNGVELTTEMIRDNESLILELKICAL